MTNRRKFIAAFGTLAVGTIAGCSGDDDTGALTDTDTPTDTETLRNPTANLTPGDTDTPSDTRTSTDTDTPESPETTAEPSDLHLDTEIQNDSVPVGETITVNIVVKNRGATARQRTLRLARDGSEVDTTTIEVASGGEETVTLTSDTSSEPGTASLALNGEAIGEVTVTRRTRLHVDPEGSNDTVGSPDNPLRTIVAALERAQPGDTVELAPGEYRELLRTQRDGEPDAPITVTGPPEAVVRPPQDVNDAVLIEHNHFHLRGVTINGLVDPERKYEDYQAWIPRCVNISPRGRREEGIEYLRDIVVEPSRLGNGARALIQVERVRNASIGNFEVIGPAGMQFDPRVDNHEVGHIREIVYVGSPEVHRGKDYYGYETLDRSRDIRIHHIDNSEGYEHNELVDVKLGSSNITVEYCTDRNAGHNTEGVVSAAIDLKGNECTVRCNDIGECPFPVSFGAWAPSEDVDGGDWSQNNAVYGNHIHDFVAGPFRLRNEGDIGPVSFEDQRTLCENQIDRGDLDIEPWMAGANGFDGLVDGRGTDEVIVEVGAGSDGRALDPAVIVVDRGTTITWDWVEGSGEHYIVDRLRTAAPSESVPDLRPAPYSESETLDMIGMTRYACYAHHEEGMVGAVVVADNPDRYAFAQAACDSDLPDCDGVGHVGGDGRWS